MVFVCALNQEVRVRAEIIPHAVNSKAPERRFLCHWQFTESPYSGFCGHLIHSFFV